MNFWKNKTHFDDLDSLSLTECIYLIDTDLVLSVYTAVVTWQTLRLFIVIITIAGRSSRATVGKRRGNNIRDDVDWTCRYRHSG